MTHFIRVAVVRPNKVIQLPEGYNRKISSNGQIYIPPPYRLSKKYYVPEPGVFFPSDEIRLYFESSPPEWQGVFDGEQHIVTMTSQGQVTIPVGFRNLSGLTSGTSVTITRDSEDGYIQVSEAESNS
jgi:bifunctional DNA-binding transcriptional regulator/antitoxin component of YhaV-PrlF toxin-antitoxin module